MTRRKRMKLLIDRKMTIPIRLLYFSHSTIFHEMFIFFEKLEYNKPRKEPHYRKSTQKEETTDKKTVHLLQHMSE